MNYGELSTMPPKTTKTNQAGLLTPPSDHVLSVDALQELRPVLQGFYQSLPVCERKHLEGLKEYDLSVALEDLYEKHLLELFLKTQTPATKRSLMTLPLEARYVELRKLKVKAEETAYFLEKKQTSILAHTVLAKQRPEQQLSLIAPYPNEFARRSVFHIEENKEKFIERDNKRYRPLLDEMPIGAGPWGITVFTGRKLYTSDEKTYVVLLGLAARQKKEGVTDWHILRGSMRNFLRESHLAENGYYTNRFIDSVKTMNTSSFFFEGKEMKQKLLDNQTKTRSQKERIGGWSLISHFEIDNTTGDYVITLGRAFIETFVCEYRMYAYMNIELFCKMPPLASALYRFYNSHLPDGDGFKRFKMLLVAKATNLLMPSDYPGGVETDNWPSPEIKRKKKTSIERALKRLIDDGAFGAKTSVHTRRRGEDDIVIVEYIDQKKIAAGEKRVKQISQK
jgi:hypothetical protein